MVDQETSIDTLSEAQAARAILRERFLRLISQPLIRQECKLMLYQDQIHTCKLRAFHPNLEAIIVENLITNYPEPIPNAIIRTNDIMSIHFQNISLQCEK